MFRDTTSEARREFQKGLDTEDFRRKRQDDRLSLRKQQRHGELMKRRRHIMQNNNNNNNNNDNDKDDNGTAIIDEGEKVEVRGQKQEQGQHKTNNHWNSNRNNNNNNNIKKVSWKNLEEYTEDIFSNEEKRIERGMEALRYLLAGERAPPIENVIKQGLIPKFIQHAKDYRSPSKQLDAMWCLSNIAGGTSYHTEQVVKHGVLSIVIDIIKGTNNSSEELIEQTFWCLGNICGDCFYYVYLVVVEKGFFEELFKVIYKRYNYAIIRQACWVINNIFRVSGSRVLDREDISDSSLNKHEDSDERQLNQSRQQIISFLPNILQLFKRLWETYKQAMTPLSPKDRIYVEESLLELLWAFSFISDDFNDPERDWGCVATICERKEVCSILVSMLYDEEVLPDFVSASLRVIGQMISCNNNGTVTSLIQAGLYNAIPKLLKSPMKTSRKETVWMLSNIAASSVEDIEKLVSHTNIMKQLVDMSLSDSLEIRKEVAWVICNCFKDGTAKQVWKIIFECYGLKAVWSLLKHMFITGQRLDEAFANNPNHSSAYTTNSHLIRSMDFQLLEVIVESLHIALQNFVRFPLQLQAVCEVCEEMEIISILEDLLTIHNMDVTCHQSIETLLMTFWPETHTFKDINHDGDVDNDDNSNENENNTNKQDISMDSKNSPNHHSESTTITDAPFTFDISDTDSNTNHTTKNQNNFFQF